MTVTMYCVVFFAFFLIGVSADDQTEKCRKVFHPDNFHCCDMKGMRPMDISDSDTWPEDYKECWNPEIIPKSCAAEECIGTKAGYYKNGVIDLEALTKIVESTKRDADVKALIKEKCLKAGADLSVYGMPDMCDLGKMKFCFVTQSLKKCTAWNDRSNCQDMKKLLEECSNVM